MVLIRRLRMLGRNTVASLISVALNLLIMAALVELLAVPHMAAAVIAYLLAIIPFYALSRSWVFPDTRRNAASGLLYFMGNVGIGFLVMLAVFWALLQFSGLHYLVARIAASVVSGIVIFVLNGLFNFKQL